MTGLTKTTCLTKVAWKSITVLPPLIGFSVGVALLIAAMHDLSLHLAAALLVGVLAVAEVGYLCLLVLANRRDPARPVPVTSKR